MTKTKIEWCNYSWNPIQGVCPVGCEYCYARKIYKRFKKDEEPRLANEKEFFSPVNSWKTRREKARIFACSTFDLFHPIADKWRDQIFQVIEMDRADTFIILTKLPHRIDRPMPDNVWLGTSIEKDAVMWRMKYLAETKAKIRFVSFEPLLDYVPLSNWPMEPEWVIIGRLTGHGHKFDPPRVQIEDLANRVRLDGAALFLKNNLRDILGEPLIQEYPK